MLSFLLLSALIQVILSGQIRPTRLLPTDGSIVHCAGQTNQNFSDDSIQSFNNYSTYLKSGTKPQSFMVYLGITLTVDQLNTWFDNFTTIMNSYSQDTWYTIQMGLWFYGNNYDCLIGQGEYDENIRAMISGFNKLGRPVYLRIGYEFNGGWTGFDPTCYIAAYQRITEFLRNDTFTNKYVATVWDYTADANVAGYMNFYPGDDFVDWWGVNVFGCYQVDDCANSNAGVNSPIVTDFMLNAANRSFPVMIGESTPRQVGYDTMPNGCLYPNAWNIWYSPYFDMILQEEYNIKAFCYINWNWWEWGYNWGMAEINECPNVGPNYQQVLTDNKGPYANAMNEEDTKKLLGL